MKFAIFDISNLVHRCRHSIRQYDTFDQCLGMITQIIFNSLSKTYYKFGAEHCVACFDSYSWRRELYPDYKLSRRLKKQSRTESEKAEDAQVDQLVDDLKEYFETQTNVTVLQEFGMEADDFIARWVQLHDDPDDSHIIVSADTDFKQLVSHNVNMFDPKQLILFTTEGVYFQDGIRPKRTDKTIKKYREVWKVKHDKHGNPETFEPEWELFKKCIRGDSSDYIKSAYPRVYEVKMRHAFDNRGTLEWNNFLNSTWGEPDNLQSVKDRYEFNKLLIDLTMQPLDVVELMDEAIELALDKKNVSFVTMGFIRFCKKRRLYELSKNATNIGRILSSSYWDASDNSISA